MQQSNKRTRVGIRNRNTKKNTISTIDNIEFDYKNKNHHRVTERQSQKKKF